MKISRNDYCPCGSGRKYKNCHWGTELPVKIPTTPRATPAPDDDDLDPAKSNVMSPAYWEKMSRKLPRGMRKEFGPMIQQIKQYADVGSRTDQIEAAAEALEPYRTEYAKLTEDVAELLRRAEKLFSEKPFEDMRFHAADVQRAFESVGYPPVGRMDKEFVNIADKAVRFLLDDAQRRSLAQRLLCTLPDYVAAGRYLDGWIIRHSADLAIEAPEGMVGPFLLAMFMHGLKEWKEQRDREQEAMFAEIGLSPEEIQQMGYDGLEGWLRDMRIKPNKTAAMEKFLAKHPELDAMTQAQCRAAEDASHEFVQRDDMRWTLLSQNEVRPWLDILEQRLANSSQGLATLPQTQEPDEATVKAFANIVNDVASEMAKNVFIAARLQQLDARLRELRRRFSDEDDHDALAGIHGALMAVRATTAPEKSDFLVTLCWTSLRAAMEGINEPSENDHSED